MVTPFPFSIFAYYSMFCLGFLVSSDHLSFLLNVPPFLKRLCHLYICLQLPFLQDPYAYLFSLCKPKIAIAPVVTSAKSILPLASSSLLERELWTRAVF
jgi:hypothetical protein